MRVMPLGALNQNKSQNKTAFCSLNASDAGYVVFDHFLNLKPGQVENLNLIPTLQKVVSNFVKSVKNDGLPEVKLNSLAIRWLGECDDSAVVAQGGYLGNQIAKATQHGIAMPELSGTETIKQLNFKEYVEEIATVALNKFYKTAQQQLRDLLEFNVLLDKYSSFKKQGQRFSNNFAHYYSFVKGFDDADKAVTQKGGELVSVKLSNSLDSWSRCNIVWKKPDGLEYSYMHIIQPYNKNLKGSTTQQILSGYDKANATASLQKTL